MANAVSVSVENESVEIPVVSNETLMDCIRKNLSFFLLQGNNHVAQYDIIPTQYLLRLKMLN